ncbi:MAG: glycosyltransferase [Saprospiraceae bacterium]|nr:glycosyltransferase [Saprospiraceae bacterium]
MYDIGIVIVNYNVRNFLIQCLHSIRNSRLYGLKVEVWVVDNASVDGSVSMLKNDFPEINLIPNAENVGFSKANNQALRIINARYVLLLNPDTVLEEETLWKCYQFMQEESDCGAVGVRMIDGAGKFLPESKRAVPDIWNSFCKLTYLSALFPKSKLFSGYNLGYLPEFESAEIEVLCGAFMFIKAETLEKTGLLDEQFFMYGEDIDLSYRIIKSGSKIFYFPETSIIHYKGESTKKSSINYIKTFYGAMILYVNKHYSKGKSGSFVNFIRFAIQLRAFMSIISKFIKSLLLPLLDLIIIFLILTITKNWWSEYYFKSSSYYNESTIKYNFLLYSFIWVLGFWFFGRYDKRTEYRNIINGVLSGTMLILVVYALESEIYRTSRALILLGTISVLIYGLLSKKLIEQIKIKFFKFSNDTPGNILIVGYRKSAEKIVEILRKAKVKTESVSVISPDPEEKDYYYINNISHLGEVVKALKIDEVIFSNESMSMKDIIKSMSGMGAGVSFKIAGDDALSIIGSKSRHFNGEFYGLDISYELNKSGQKRFKRFVDLIFGILFLVLLPFILLVNTDRKRMLKLIIEVIFGSKTWVGYGGDVSDYSFLPELKPCAIPYPESGLLYLYSDDYYKTSNIEYAKNYSVWIDLDLILKNIFSLTRYTSANTDL